MKSVSSAADVYVALPVAAVARCSHAVCRFAGPGIGSVVPLIGSEYGCGFAVPSRARTRHW